MSSSDSFLPDRAAQAESPLAGDALDRYLTGTLDDPARAALLDRLTAQPTRFRAFVHSLRAWVRYDELMAQMPNVDASVVALRARLAPLPVSSEAPVAAAGAHSHPRHAGIIARPSRVWRTGGAAALALVMVAVGWAMVRGRSSERANEARIYRTASGQVTIVTLTDGSRVMLAPSSTLHVQPGFGGATRSVSLSGEASFDVTGQSGAPFLVHAGDATARVLGTTFSVRYDDPRAPVQVNVVSGRVALSDSVRPAVTLTAGMVGTVTDSTATARRADELAEYSAWVNGELVFRGVTARDVLARVGRWYGYELRMSDTTLASQKISAGISSTSLPEALATLGIVLDAEPVITGHVITWQPVRRARGTPRAPQSRLVPRILTNQEVGR